MTRLTDGTKTVEITMNNWTGSGWTPDWSQDFFQVGCCEKVYDEESNIEAYSVSDVDYCVSCAQDWEHGRWEDDDEADPEEIETRNVNVNYL